MRPEPEESTDNAAVLGRFLEEISRRKVELYPAQETAILELFDEKNVILNTPTGSGKSLVAAALHYKSLAQGKRSVYTCPIKALVNEKWLALCREFGSDQVGLSTGDATVHRDAPILCCTAEVLANIALRQGSRAPVDEVIMDEFHYYSDRERGAAWQIPLLTLPQARFLLMSATLGDTSFFESELTRCNRRETITVRSDLRPVPLDYAYAETPLSQTIETLITDGRSPVYVVHFTQLSAAETAQDCTSLHLCSREEKSAISQALEGCKFNSPYGPEIRKWLRHGIGLHHAGLLPKYRVLIEQLAQRGLLKVICGTDTLGVGINVPIRTVLFTQLCKYTGEKTALLSAREFHQISGRAGRKGFDDCGWVVAQAPEHAIENLLRAQKQAAGGKKFVKRKPPEKHFVNWDRQTFARLMAAPPERLTSQFRVSHGMLLNVLSRPEDGCRAVREILRQCHESPANRKALTRRAWQLFRALVERGVVSFVPRTAEGAKVRVNIDLQEDFSMHQTLSLYVLDTIPLLDRESPEYALDVVTLVESILEDPEIVLRKQLDRVRTEALAEMKAQGMEYEQRVAELERLEYPKPLRDFVYGSFNDFADRHPWVGEANIRPKSIAREMFEGFWSFTDYIKLYELQRAEGILLRHLSSVLKVLAHTVPDKAKDEAFQELECYLAEMLRQIDSSLLEAWESLRGTAGMAAEDASPVGAGISVPQGALPPPGAGGPARDPKALTAAIRVRIFSFLRLFNDGNLEEALELLQPAVSGEGELAPREGAPEPDAPWTTERLAGALQEFHAEHERVRLDPEARNLRHTHVSVSEDGQTWIVQQTLVDPDELNDWIAEFAVNAAASIQTPDLRLRHIGPLSAP